MKHLALLPLSLLFIAPASYAGRVYDLAGQPEAVVDEQGVCHITGALWRDHARTGTRIRSGPVRNERMVLRQIGGDRTFEVTTDDQGIYRIAIPVYGHTVFQEAEIGRQGWTGSMPKAYCIRSKVEVGELIPLSK